MKWFFIRFEDNKDFMRFLEEGPYFFDSRIIIMKRWSLRLKFDRDILSTLLVWVKLMYLDLELWDIEALSTITSVISKPIELDEVICREARSTFTRVLVEMDATLDFPSEI